MESLSLSNILAQESLAFIDESVDENIEGRARRAVPSSGYSAVGFLDSLSAYAAVFGCSGTCGA